MNTTEALQALLDGKKITNKYWEKELYIYLKNNNICSNSSETDFCGFSLLDEIDSWEEYVEPKKDEPKKTKLKMYLLYLNASPMTTSHVVCASSKKEARRIIAENQARHYNHCNDNIYVKRWKSVELSSCLTLCNASGNYSSLVPNSVIV
jgi:hypothetical protein